MINFYRPVNTASLKITVSIYRLVENTLKEIHTEPIPGPKDFYKWTNIHAGEYSIYVYLDRHDCELDCTGQNSGFCNICNYTVLNITVPEDRFLKPYGMLNAISSVVSVLIPSKFLERKIIFSKNNSKIVKAFFTRKFF